MGAPHAEILIEPLRDETEIDPLERRFECELNLSVLDLQLDQLQPKRALAERHDAQSAQADAHARCLQQAAFANQRSPLHVEHHAMGRSVGGVMHQRPARQQDADLQPVGGWDKFWRGGLGAECVE